MDNNRTYYSHDAEIRETRKTVALILLAIGVGASVGAAAGLIFAPNTGKKTRDSLSHSIEHTLEQGASKGHEVVDPTLKRLEKELAEMRKSIEGRG